MTTQNRFYSSTAAPTTVTSPVGNADTTMVVAATTGFPGSTPYTLIIDYGLASEEILSVTNVSGLTLTISRAQGGSSAVAHASGAAVIHGVYSDDFTEAAQHIQATAAHGATGAVVGTTNTQVLTNKTLTTPTIGSMVNANHNHSAGAGGGNIPESSVTNLTSDLATLSTNVALKSNLAGGNTFTGAQTFSDTATFSSAIVASAGVQNGLGNLASHGLIFQSNSTTGTTDSNGDLVITYPTAFSTACLSMIGQNGDGVATSVRSVCRHGSLGASSTTFRFFGTSGAAYASLPVRLDWLAVGY